MIDQLNDLIRRLYVKDGSPVLEFRVGKGWRLLEGAVLTPVSLETASSFIEWLDAEED